MRHRVGNSHLPRRQLGPLLASADICIATNKDVPAARAFLQNKLFDYLASRKPVLVNYPGDTADLLTSTGSGMVVRAQDPDARQRMGKNGRWAVLEKYNWETERGKLLDTYSKLLGGADV